LKTIEAYHKITVVKLHTYTCNYQSCNHSILYKKIY